MKLYENKKEKYYYCPCRKMFLLKTPEEEVRQRVLRHLIDRMDVPANLISSEYRLSKIDGKLKKRADIVVWSEGKPLLVIEVKASHIALTEQVLTQVKSYNKILGAKYVGISNGNEIKLYESKVGIMNPIPISEDLISYAKLVKGNVEKIRIKEMKRLPYELVTYERYVKFVKDSGYIADDTPAIYHPFLAEFQNYILKGEMKFHEKYGISILKDLFYGYFTFENASGGGYPGYYRSFIIKDFLGDDAIYRIGIFGTNSYKNDPLYGNRKGATYLNIAIDRSGKATNLLQLNFDKFADFDDTQNKFRFWHDGRRSRVKNSKTIEALREWSPKLLMNKKVDLGLLPSNEQLTSRNTSDFMERILAYAAVRNTL